MGANVVAIANTSTLPNTYSALVFRNSDSSSSTSTRHGAAIALLKDGSWDTINSYPGHLTFWTRGSFGEEVERMRITSSGNLGIGTTSPTRTLDVNGDVRFRFGIYDVNNTAGSASSVLTADGNGGWSWQPIVGSGGAISGINVSQDDTGIRYPLLAAGTNASTTAQYIDNNGLVYNTQSNCLGIGSLTPTSALDVRGIGQFVNNSNQLFLHTGVNSPTVIHRNDGANYYILLSNSGTTPSGTWNGLRPLYIDLTNGLLNSLNGQSFYGTTLIGASSPTGTASQLLQVTGGAYVSGNLGIGSLTPTYKLDVIGSIRSNTEVSTPTINSPSGSVLFENSGISVDADSNFETNLEVGGNLTVSSINGGQLAGFRNIIINGDMFINNRAVTDTNPTGIVTVQFRQPQNFSRESYHTFAIDRWVCSTIFGRVEYKRTSAAPLSPEFPYSLSYKTLTGFSGANGYSGISQHIEGASAYHLNYGTSTPLPVTVSFWVKSTIAGVYSIALRTFDAESGPSDNQTGYRTYTTTYTINQANVAQKIVVTIPGDTNRSMSLYESTEGLCLIFTLGASNYYSTATINTWQNGNLPRYTGALLFTETQNAVFQITGVQLETGTTATPFERRSPVVELSMCQRFAERCPFNLYCEGYQTNQAFVNWLNFKVKKRASPTLYNPYGGADSGLYYSRSGFPTGKLVNNSQPDGCYMGIISNGGTSFSTGGFFVADSEFIGDATTTT
jgi:hypothetical protein